MLVFTILKVFLASIAALFATVQIIPGISYQGDLRILAAAALVFAFLHSIVKPILNFITTPLNFLTLGLVSAGLNVVIFYALTYLVPSFTFSAATLAGFALGPVGVIVAGAVAAAILLGLFEKILNV
ncbi:MAG: phage holin family protein [Patescibacteria group bacterium]